MIYKTLQRKLQIMQREPPKTGSEIRCSVLRVTLVTSPVITVMNEEV